MPPSESTARLLRTQSAAPGLKPASNMAWLWAAAPSAPLSRTAWWAEKSRSTSTSHPWLVTMAIRPSKVTLAPTKSPPISLGLSHWPASSMGDSG